MDHYSMVERRKGGLAGVLVSGAMAEETVSALDDEGDGSRARGEGIEHEPRQMALVAGEVDLHPLDLGGQLGFRDADMKVLVESWIGDDAALGAHRQAAEDFGTGGIPGRIRHQPVVTGR